MMDAFLVYKGKVFPVEDNHVTYVTYNYDKFGISDEKYHDIEFTSEPDDVGLELLNEAIRNGAIQVRNIDDIRMTVINLKDHSKIDELIDSILDNPNLYKYKMQVNFVAEDDGGVANNIEELFNL